MPKLKAGDRVSCKLKESKIVSPYATYDDIRTFEIISVDEKGYFLFIPSYIFIKESFKIDNYSYKRIGVPPKYIGDDSIHIDDGGVYQVAFIMEGQCCKRCSEFFDYAEVNQPDGSMMCWSCRKDPYR
jgi:hypothetical protein